MSGGSLDYASFKINSIIEDLQAKKELDADYVHNVLPEINELIAKLEIISHNIYELEWYLSGDTGIDRMHDEWKKM